MSCSRVFYAPGDTGREIHRLLSDKEFLMKVTDCSLEPAGFTHEAHIRLAWLVMDTHDFEESVDVIAGHIARFDKAHGDGRKFNLAITKEASKLIWDHKSRAVSDSFPEFAWINGV